ncbi:MAG TPA: hypothetical protein VJ300_06230 [Thermoplasmata archaeon]|nr:hypothetical protein [Thermoplasmata archaeon]HLB68559.1 hypothetical protein [Thermoplasmata archaeon]
MESIGIRVLERIRGIVGVVRAELLRSEDRNEIVRRAVPQAADNRGVSEVLSRGRVVCLFKDRTFRPPPEPTLLLVDERGRVLGQEIIPGLPVAHPGTKAVRLGRDFLLFADQESSGRLRFVLPPVRFPELEDVRDIDRLVSASPDPPQDDYLRARFGIPPGTELASILVGYDEQNP